MKRTSLRWKTVNFLFIMVALAFFIGIILCVVFSSHFFTNYKQNRLRELFIQMNSAEYSEESRYALMGFCEANNITLMIKDTAGNRLFSYGYADSLSQRLDDIMFSPKSSISMNDTVTDSTDNYTLLKMRDNETGRLTYIEMWGFLDSGNSFIARSSFSSIQNNIRVSLTFFAIVCAVILIVCAIAIYFIIGYYSKPLTRLAALTQKVNEGDFNTKYEYNHLRQDEIGVLGANINEISEKLEKNIAELKSTNLNLENELKAKTELEEARKKYMSDVSHELKTPIALISGYAEGLKEGISDDPEDREFYCDVIIEEAEKMNIMIKRLSTLNQLEDGKSDVNLERFDAVQVVDGFLNTMSMIIEEKGANVYFNKNATAYVWSDEFLFEEVLMNYFNNALNHMDERAMIKINVESRDDNNTRVTVFNSGENIPEDELEKIWTKFYKVDKARTREYGGSGLGLSIVKAIADSLNKKCGVENLPDGVAFWIELESAQAPAYAADEEKPEVQKRLKLSELPVWGRRVKIAGRSIGGADKTKIIDKKTIRGLIDEPAKGRRARRKRGSDKE